MQNRHILLLIVSITAVSLLAVTIVTARRDDSFNRIISNGVIKIGYAVEAPYAYVAPNGEITGESPETAKLIAKRLGIPRIEWIQVPFGDLISSLEDRRFDVIAAGLFITKERARHVLFSSSTLHVRTGLLIKKNNPRLIGLSLTAPIRHDIVMATLAGSIEQERLKNLGFTHTNTLVVPDIQSGQAALRKGLADALVLSLPTLRWIANKYPDTFDVISDVFSNTPNAQTDHVAFAFNTQDTSLQREWNKASSGWIGTAEHIQAIKPFGFDAADVVDTMKTDNAIKIH